MSAVVNILMIYHRVTEIAQRVSVKPEHYLSGFVFESYPFSVKTIIQN